MLYNYKSLYTSCIFLFVLIRCSSNVYASYYYSFGVNLLLLVCHVMIVRVMSINHVHHTILTLSLSLNWVIIDCSICILVLMTYNSHTHTELTFSDKQQKITYGQSIAVYLQSRTVNSIHTILYTVPVLLFVECVCLPITCTSVSIIADTNYLPLIISVTFTDCILCIP